MHVIVLTVFARSAGPIIDPVPLAALLDVCHNLLLKDHRFRFQNSHVKYFQGEIMIVKSNFLQNWTYEINMRSGGLLECDQSPPKAHFRHVAGGELRLDTHRAPP